jgi:hypothetical protein
MTTADVIKAHGQTTHIQIDKSEQQGQKQFSYTGRFPDKREKKSMMYAGKT